MKQNNLDWEKEYDKDVIFAIEKQKDIEDSWEQWQKEQNRKPIKITYEHHTRSPSFRRDLKKILQFRSHILIETNY